MRGKCEQEPLLSFLWEEMGPMGLRLGNFSRLCLGHRSLVVSSLARGDEGRWTVALMVRA